MLRHGLGIYIRNFLDDKQFQWVSAKLNEQKNKISFESMHWRESKKKWTFRSFLLRKINTWKIILNNESNEKRVIWLRIHSTCSWRNLAIELSIDSKIWDAGWYNGSSCLS